MRKMFLVAVALLCVSVVPASAFEHWGHFFKYGHHAMKGKAAATTTTVTTSGGQVWSCVMNPATGLICVVVVGIVVQTIKEVRAGCTNDINLARWWMTWPCPPVRAKG